MKRKLVCLLLTVCLLASLGLTAYAVTFNPAQEYIQDLSSYMTFTNHKDGTITVHMPDLTQSTLFGFPLGYLVDTGSESATIISMFTQYPVGEYGYEYVYSLTTQKDITLNIEDEDYPETLGMVGFVYDNFTYVDAIGGFVNPTKVTYDLNGGSVSGSTDSKAEWLEDGDALATTFNEPSKNGHLFEGWFTAPEGGDQVTASTGDAMTVYAHYSEKHVHNWQINREHDKAVCDCGGEVTLSAKSGTIENTVGQCVDVKSNVDLPYTVQVKKLGENGARDEVVRMNCQDEGNYQAWLRLDDQGNGLYANFTLTNPKTTAATGDNRPIELIVFGFAAMSVMAAAAFVADRKRG